MPHFLRGTSRTVSRDSEIELNKPRTTPTTRLLPAPQITAFPFSFFTFCREKTHEPFQLSNFGSRNRLNFYNFESSSIVVETPDTCVEHIQLFILPSHFSNFESSSVLKRVELFQLFVFRIVNGTRNSFDFARSPIFHCQIQNDNSMSHLVATHRVAHTELRRSFFSNCTFGKISECCFAGARVRDARDKEAHARSRTSRSNCGAPR